MTSFKAVLALDVGSKRIGVAIASMPAGLAKPLTTLSATDPAFLDKLTTLINEQSVTHVVIGWPRGLSGQSTPQTKSAEQFAKLLKSRLKLSIDMQDEALTSRRAEEELGRRKKPFRPEDIDALAATYILNDWLAEHQEILHA
jgi:putative Holliday junction resolvase